MGWQLWAHTQNPASPRGCSPRDAGAGVRACEGAKESALVYTSSGARSICLITALNASAQHTMRAH